MKESNLMRKCLLELSKVGRYFRNNTGLLQGHDGRFHRYGLAVGSSDIIGCTPIVVTNKMVGQKVGLFTAIEVKSDAGKATKEQVAFIEMVKNQGGIAGIARSEKESLVIIQNYLDLMK
jgi:hypothetical protein